MLGMIPSGLNQGYLTSCFALSHHSKVSTQPYFAFSHPDKVPSRSHTSPLRITAKSHHRIHPYELPHPLHMPQAAFTIQEPFHLAFESSSTNLSKSSYQSTNQSNQTSIQVINHSNKIKRDNCNNNGNFVIKVSKSNKYES